MELRQRALEVLCLTDPAQKVAATVALHEQAGALALAVDTALQVPAGALLPGHPERPPLVRHTEVVKRSPSTVEGRAALLHSIVTNHPLVDGNKPLGWLATLRQKVEREAGPPRLRDLTGPLTSTPGEGRRTPRPHRAAR